jgi:hypothetical protein
MERPEAKSVIVIAIGALVIAAAIISALPGRSPVVDPLPSDRTSTTSSATARIESTPQARSSAESMSIQVQQPVGPGKPFEAVQIDGTLEGGPKSLLQVQRRDRERWVSFPVPTMTDESGRFATHVEFDQRGQYWLRVLDPESGATSEPFLLVIKD